MLQKFQDKSLLIGASERCGATTSSELTVLPARDPGLSHVLGPVRMQRRGARALPVCTARAPPPPPAEAKGEVPPAWLTGSGPEALHAPSTEGPAYARVRGQDGWHVIAGASTPTHPMVLGRAVPRPPASLPLAPREPPVLF